MEELNKIPPVTRTLLFATLGVTVPCLLTLVSPYVFFLWWPAVVRKWQIWRPFTAFFFGGSGLELLFDIFLLYRNSNDLEMNKFYRKTADYAWALTLINILILLTNYPLQSPVLFRPLMMALVYLWSRANEHASVSLFGLINCPAKYLPYTYLGFDLLRGGPPYAIQSATGLLSAYIYDFFKEVLPATNGGRGPRYVPDTPAFLRALLPDSVDPATRGQTPQPGGSVRSTSWGGTAFAPAGRSFGDDRAGASAAATTTGGNRLNSPGRGGGLGSWLPFGRGSSVGNASGSSSRPNRTQPDRDAMLAAAEARLRSLRENSIAGRNQAASAAAAQAASSAEAQARAVKTHAQSSSSTASSVLRGAEGSRSTGIRRGEETVATRRSGLRSNFGSLGTNGREEEEEEEQETASGSGGRVAEIRRARGGESSSSQADGEAGSQGEQGYSWGDGRRLGDN